VKEVPGSRFVTPDELAGLFEPQNEQSISRDELRRLAEKLLADWKDSPPDFVDLGERAYSLVNAYEAMAKALAHYGEKRALPDRVTVTDLYGPIAEGGEITYCKAGEVSLPDLCTAIAATLKEAERLTPRRVAIKVAVGKTEINCAEFLRAMAQAYVALAKGNTPATVKIEPSKVMPPYADVLERFFQPEDDRPLRYSQLQLWTVKPAAAKREGRKAKGDNEKTGDEIKGEGRTAQEGIRDGQSRPWSQPEEGWSEPVNLSNLNTEHTEKRPYLSPDGNTLIWGSSRPKKMSGFWMSQWTGSGWSDPVEVERTSPGFSFESVVSRDGKLSVFVRRGSGLWYATREGDHWGEPKSMGPEVNHSGKQGLPAISPDGNTVYFWCVEREGNFGKEDIWRTRRGSGVWQKAEHLGPQVNTVGDEYCPWVSADGHVLYFGRTRFRGPPQGAEQHIWASRIDDQGALGEAVKLSPKFNVPGYSSCCVTMSMDGKKLVFASKRPGGRGDWDLWMVTRK
jgi:hypothetical protein